MVKGKKRSLYTTLVPFLTCLLFIFNFNTVNSTEDSNTDPGESYFTSEKDYSEENIQNSTWPYRVWDERTIYSGHIPPETVYVEQRIFDLWYRGWLTRTDRTDGVWFVIYEGYLYRPDVPLPIPSRAAPIEI